jgi:hypothetical protein
VQTTRTTYCFIALLLSLCGHASAGTITDIFDTGVDGNGVPLPDATSPDPHYTIIAGSDGSVACMVTVKTSASGFPVAGPPFWNADSATSAWIMPSAGYPGDTNMPVGFYDYLTTFTLPAGAISVSISANLVVDNQETDILLNGESVGAPQINTSSSLETYTPISFTSGNVLAGVNDLLFVVYNSGPPDTSGPTGLRVDGITGSYAAVPEPSVFALLSLASIGFLPFSRQILRGRGKLNGTSSE